MPAPQTPTATPGAVNHARLYLSRQAASPGRYLLEQTIQALAGGVPSLASIDMRATRDCGFFPAAGSPALVDREGTVYG